MPPVGVPPTDAELGVLVGKHVMVAIYGIDWAWLEGQLIEFDGNAVILETRDSTGGAGVPPGDWQRLLDHRIATVDPERANRISRAESDCLDARASDAGVSEGLCDPLCPLW
jgi:hypothetical protein